MGLILKITIIAVGVILIPVSVICLAKRRMNESLCLVWGVISVGMIVSGVLINPEGLLNSLGVGEMIAVLIIFAVVIFAALCMSYIISELMRKNSELAIQVSLLSRENEEIKKELGEVRK